MKMSQNYRRPSKKLTVDDAKKIIDRLHKREFQNRIAADYDVNPGRISDIKTGKTFGWLKRPWETFQKAA